MRGLGDEFRMGKFFSRRRTKMNRQESTKIHAFIDSHVARAFEQSEKPDGTGELSAMPQPQRYVLLEEMAKEMQDPMDLRYQLLNVFQPASNATVIAVSNMIFLLARYQSVQDKLRFEISTLTSPSLPLSFELLKSMKYLRYVFNESKFPIQPNCT